MQLRMADFEVDREPQRVEDFSGMPALSGRFPQPPRAVTPGTAGQNCEFHKRVIEEHTPLRGAVVAAGISAQCGLVNRNPVSQRNRVSLKPLVWQDW